MSEKVTALPQFNAAEVEPRTPFEAKPPGWYLMQVVDGEFVDKGESQRIKIETEILEGTFAEQKHFDGFNFKNPNPKAESIGQSNFSGLCRAVNVLTPVDISELYNIPFYGKLKLKAARKGVDDEGNEKDYEPSNELVDFRPASEPPKGYAGGMVTTTPANPSGRPPAPGGSKPPAAPKAASAPPKAPTPPKPAAAAPTPPPAPKPAAPKAPPAPPKSDRKFYVVVNDETVEKTEAEVVAMIDAQEIAIADPCMLSTESEWKTVGDYAIGVAPKPAAPAGPKAPPWKKK